MSINETYAVFGLGRYGSAVAKELTESGAEVIAVDINQDIIDDMCSIIPNCKCADITEAETIKRLGISNIDTVIISMASCLEAGVMATMLCKEAGVKTVIVKCANEMHEKIYQKIGADRVVFPEKESGVRLANNLLSSGFIDMIGLSHSASMLEIDVKKEWVGKNLAELKLRKKYSLNVVAIRTGEHIDTVIDPTAVLDDTMKLIVIADNSKLDKLK